MKRRQLLTAIGGITGVTSFAIGTGAFTSITASRTVTLDVADDDRAFLRLEPLVDNGISGEETGRSYSSGRTVQFELPGTGDGENPNAGGLGTDSIYEFHDLLRIENQGTQPVRVYSTYDGSTFANLALVHDSGVLRDDPPVLDLGESVNVGLLINTHSTPTRATEYDEMLTIIADQPD